MYLTNTYNFELSDNHEVRLFQKKYVFVSEITAYYFFNHFKE